MPRVTRATTTDAIEPDLAALWRDVVRQGPVARAVMSNLIVFRECGDNRAPAAGELATALLLEEIAARHPCRLIVLDHQRNRADEPDFAVTIGVLTFGPERARYGIEQIAVRSACAEVQLPSIVRQVVRGDVPTSVWWTDDLSRVPPLGPIIAMGRQFVYDSRLWSDLGGGMSAARSLAESHGRLDMADLNWRRLTPVRQALLHACALLRAGDLCRGPVHITHPRGESALAWLCAGWLGSRLRAARGVRPLVEEDRGSSGVVLSVHIGDEAAGLEARLEEHQVVVSGAGQAMPLTIAVPHESEANAIAAELRNLSHDAALHEAITTAALLLQ